MQEIRDVAEKWRQSDAGLPALSAAAPFSRRLSPNLTYDHSNRVVRWHAHCITMPEALHTRLLIVGSACAKLASTLNFPQPSCAL